MSWTVKTKLSRGDIAKIVDALAEERDHTGAAPSGHPSLTLFND